MAAKCLLFAFCILLLIFVTNGRSVLDGYKTYHDEHYENNALLKNLKDAAAKDDAMLKDLEDAAEKEDDAVMKEIEDEEKQEDAKKLMSKLKEIEDAMKEDEAMLKEITEGYHAKDATQGDKVDVMQSILDKNKESKTLTLVNTDLAHIYEGDMLLKDRQNRERMTGHSPQGDLVTWSSLHWPTEKDSDGNDIGVKIPYILGTSGQTDDIKLAMKEAIDEFNAKTCVQFIERTNEVDYIEVIDGSGCWSWVGKQGGSQQLSLQDYGCTTRGIAVHELMHAAGYYHEQSRPDRDLYVTINFTNVVSGQEHNFDTQQTDNQGTPYDYNSVMHYGAYAFSKNGEKTIIAKNNELIGQGDGLSDIDALSLNKFYCKGRTEVSTTQGPTTSTTSTGTIQPEISTSTTIVPEVSTTEFPEISTTEFPEISTTEFPEISTTEFPEISTTEFPEISTTEFPEVSTTEFPEVSTTEFPEISTTEFPEVSTTEFPEISTTEFPEVSTTEFPEISTTEFPEVSTTEYPEISTTEFPEVSTTEYPEITTTELPTVMPIHPLPTSEKFCRIIRMNGFCSNCRLNNHCSATQCIDRAKPEKCLKWEQKGFCTSNKWKRKRLMSRRCPGTCQPYYCDSNLV